MNFTALASHGLRALSVHAELIGVRLLVATIIATVVLFTAFAVLFAMRWSVALIGLGVLFLGQIVASSVVFVLLVLHGRSQPLFIPLRDYSYFVKGLTVLSPASAAPASVG